MPTGRPAEPSRRPRGELPIADLLSHRRRDPSLGRGVVASVVASALFGGLFLLARLLRALDADAFFAWRVLVTLPVVAAVFACSGGGRSVLAVLQRMGRRPVLLLVLVLDGHMLGVQLWLFGWAPQTGHGLEAALGYLLLPLVMVVAGVALHRERLSLIRSLAVAAAALGVLAALVLAGGLSPVTVLVALGYPVYFSVRRRAGLDTRGAFLLELVVLVPAAAWFLATSDAITPLEASPALLGGVALLGAISATALVLYLAASTALGFALFGLLTYLEPVLLIVVSVALLGERLAPGDGLVYGPIGLALVLLAVEPFAQRAGRRRPGSAPA